MNYIHICQFEINMFTQSIVNMIKDNPSKFTDNHRFVVYDKHISDANVHVDYPVEYNDSNSFCDTLKKYSAECDYFIVHYFPFLKLDYFRIPRNIYKRIIWIEWGGDLYFDKNGEKQSILRKLYTKLRCHFLKNVYAVGVAGWYDTFKVKKLLGDDIKVFGLSYGYKKGKIDFYNKIYNQRITNNGIINVLVGNSSNGDFHIPIIKELTRFSDKICINVILSYGNNDNKEKIREYLINHYKGKYRIIDEFMDIESYSLFLKSIDVGVFDMPNQNSLGNIHMLTSFGAKVFVNPNNIAFMESNLMGYQVYSTELLKTITFDDFSTPFDKSFREHIWNVFTSGYYDENRTVILWSNCFDQLRKNNER